MNLDVNELLDRLAKETRRSMEERGCKDPVVVGIRTGGVWIAERLRSMLKIESPLNRLNVNFYRDDFHRGGLNTQNPPSELESDLDDRHIILVDDVLQTGRTVRAALNEVFDYGRPQSILLAVLLSRKRRELPICADSTGIELDLKHEQTVKLKGPDPLKLEIH